MAPQPYGTCVLCCSPNRSSPSAGGELDSARRGEALEWVQALLDDYEWRRQRKLEAGEEAGLLPDSAELRRRSAFRPGSPASAHFSSRRAMGCCAGRRWHRVAETMGRAAG
jgi:hypothetical protein